MYSDNVLRKELSSYVPENVLNEVLKPEISFHNDGSFGGSQKFKLNSFEIFGNNIMIEYRNGGKIPEGTESILKGIIDPRIAIPYNKDMFEFSRESIDIDGNLLKVVYKFLPPSSE